MRYLGQGKVCKSDICFTTNVDIDTDIMKGSIYTQEFFIFGMTSDHETIKADGKIYTIEVYKCTPGRGCRFKIHKIEDDNDA